ncbi:GGDEF domain-containing protein [Lentzea sp. NBRC 105346]|uniref:sensor domain-containing diguanylate cyclase n=1 Tax=Lentzea sp. NBRC 105346 TaxID=3032205 RepID=UPI002553B906|nr:GGDEF domain-containing protein [Lentzea sp. NBRC 105346]
MTWSLWSLPRRAVAYVLLVDVAALTLAVLAARPVGARSWVTFGVFAACAVAHLQASQWIERIRRDHSRVPHVDLCSIWIFAGALALPALPAVLLVAVIYLHRWWMVGRWDASRPPHRSVFTASMMTLVVLAAGSVARLTGFTDGTPSGFNDLLSLVVSGATHWTVNTALVAGIVVMTAKVHPREAIGTAGDNLLEAGQLALGGFVALGTLWWPGFAVPMVVAAVALHRTVLIHQLELAARTDTKTGLLNAEAWHLQARMELHRLAQQPGTRLGLFMVDVDHFKDINDTHGHQVGDEVLRQIAATLDGAVRRGDSVGRFGGEEFAVLLPGVDAAEAMVIAERIRTQVHTLRVGAIGGFGVSIGVAVWPDVSEDTVEGLLAAADAALYQAKRAGRDQVQLAGRDRRQPWSPAERQ